MNYASPPVGEVATSVLSIPEREMRKDLENFVEMVELGGLGSQTPSKQPPFELR